MLPIWLAVSFKLITDASFPSMKHLKVSTYKYNSNIFFLKKKKKIEFSVILKTNTIFIKWFLKKDKVNIIIIKKYKYYFIIICLGGRRLHSPYVCR
jgi:hypothetical protein